MRTLQLEPFLKGALDKYNIYFFKANSVENFEFKPVPKFSADSANAFSFYEYFVNSTVSRVSHRLLYCVFVEDDFEK